MALAHAILACLVERPCSGYDLAKQFDSSVGYFWSASHQQIYRELSKLEEQGWITQTIPQSERPNKKLYCITNKGDEQLRTWIASPCEPMAIKDDLLVKIFAGYVASSGTVLAEIERHREAHLKRLSAYKELEQQHFQNPQTLPIAAKFQYLTLLKGISYETDWLAWCDQAMKLLYLSN